MGGSALAAKAAYVVPTIDLTLLKEATDGDGTLLRELIAVAHCQIETECSTLLRALDSGEMATAVGLSHSLKGSSGSVGARALAELSAQLEEAAGGNDAQGAVALRAQLAAETAKVLAALDAA